MHRVVARATPPRRRSGWSSTVAPYIARIHQPRGVRAHRASAWSSPGCCSSPARSAGRRRAPTRPRRTRTGSMDAHGRRGRPARRQPAASRRLPAGRCWVRRASARTRARLTERGASSVDRRHTSRSRELEHHRASVSPAAGAIGGSRDRTRPRLLRAESRLPRHAYPRRWLRAHPTCPERGIDVPSDGCRSVERGRRPISAAI